MLWHLSNRASRTGVKLADRHYSRQKPGSPQFVKPGSCLVLETAAADALWVTSWPKAEYVAHEWAGAWECSLFRNEGPACASELILQAVAATRARYGEPPALGMITGLDPRKVEAVVRHGLPTFGYSWRAAGFRYVGRFKDGKLVFRLTAERMPPAEHCHGVQLELTAAEA
jgi:hypothetical protein